MRWVVCTSALALVLAGGTVGDAQPVAVSFETLTVGTTAVGLATGTITPGSSTDKVDLCRGRLEVAQVRYRDDGTAPTASVGLLLEVGDLIAIDGSDNITNFRAIRTGGTSGTLPIQCYRR